MKKLFSLLILSALAIAVALSCASCKKQHVHTAAEPVVENEVAATCTKGGSYELVTYCAECNEVMSRVAESTKPTGHKGGDVKIENKVKGSCTTDEIYDEVVYCETCNYVMSRDTVVITAKGHEAAAAVTEKIAATCTTHGHTDSVVYCKNCDLEITRIQISYDATPLGHTPEDAVVENYVKNSCTKDGGYDEVVYCSACTDENGTKTEIDRIHFTIPMREHTASETAVTEGQVSATCLRASSYDTVIYCSECGVYEFSRTTVYGEKLVHSGTYTEVEGYVHFTCTTDGGYYSVEYCKDCGLEHSRAWVEIEAHCVAAEPIKANVVEATPEKDGSYDLITYCVHCKEMLAKETVAVPYGDDD